MLNLLDQTIQAVLDTGWTTTPPPAKPGFFFTIPDEDWLTKVKSALGLRLNIYLYEIRENKDFRRPEWDVIPLPGNTVTLSHPPVYCDCHYLISAWSPTEDGEATTPMLDEHQVLGEALRVLYCNPDVNPAALGVIGGSAVFQQAHIYLTVFAPEAPRILNDFWSTMKLPWRPAIQLVATAPLDLLQDTPPVPLMTTFVQRYAVLGGSGSPEERVTIGGWVLKNADNSPIPGATVHATCAAPSFDQSVTTDSQGRYAIAGMRPGTYHLSAAAAGFSAIDRDLDIPTGPPDDHIFKLS